MRDVLKDLELWRAEGESVALATLVGVRGSAPRLPGARMAMTAGGRMSGSVSGGCVENDVMDRAIRVLESGRAELVGYNIVDDDELVGVGLHCGSIEVLIQPYEPGVAWTALLQAVENETPAVLATALRADSGTQTGLLGRQMTITATDTTGTIRADVDAAVRDEALRRLEGGGTGRVAVDVEGGLDAFVEVFGPRPHLFIVGGTHTAVPLCRMAAEVGFRVTIVDPRKTFSNRERFPEADDLCREWPEQAFGGDRLDAESFVVTVSHDTKFDVPALAAAMRSGVRYIGALGSRATHARRREKLTGLGFRDDQLDAIHSPVGLDIGAEGAEEIAVAILAELLAVRRGREGGLLRDSERRSS